MLAKKYLVFVAIAIFVWTCAKVPITGRRQINLLPETQMIQMAEQSYSQFLSEATEVPASSGNSEMVSRLGNNIANAVEKYLADHHMSNRVEGFNWEFRLVDDPTVNAWCMPGGKVVVYTGIMEVAQNEAGLAVVMGHEIAHAIARHGNERMSSQVAIQGGGVALSVLMSQKPAMAQNLFLSAYGIGSQLGSLKFSRNHESEADKMGVIFSAMAGYDPNEAPKFWERMAAASGGQAPPEFMSTHPSHDTRIADLTSWIPEAMTYYNNGQGTINKANK